MFLFKRDTPLLFIYVTFEAIHLPHGAHGTQTPGETQATVYGKSRKILQGAPSASIQTLSRFQPGPPNAAGGHPHRHRLGPPQAQARPPHHSLPPPLPLQLRSLQDPPQSPPCSPWETALPSASLRDCTEQESYHTPKSKPFSLTTHLLPTPASPFLLLLSPDSSFKITGMLKSVSVSE